MTYSENRILERFARQVALPEVGGKGQARLKDTSVLVVGCGGLGCTVAQILVAAGIGKIGLIDHDLVQLSNLHRQILFDETCIGMPKVQAAAKRLSKINSDAVVSAYFTRWGATEELTEWHEYHVIVDATDNFETRYAIDRWCFYNKKPLVFGSVDAWQGMVSVFHVSPSINGKCFSYAALFPSAPAPNTIGNCESNGVMPSAVHLIGAVQANEVLKIALQDLAILEGKVWVVNLLEMEFYSFILKPKVFPLQEQSYPMQSLSAIDLNRLLESSTDLVLLDVRELHEVQMISFDALHIPMNDVPRCVPQIDKEKKTVVICKMGVRSAYVIEYLQREHGFTNLVNLHGGIFDFHKNFPNSPFLKRANSFLWPST